VIYTRESDLAPHFLNDRKGVYVRTNEFSRRFEARLANETELRHLLDRRKIIRDRRINLLNRARQRFHTFVERRYRELSDGKENIGCRFDFSIIPRFPAEPLCDHSRLMSLIQSKKLNWRGVGFPRASIGCISQHESAIVLRPGSNFSILEANIWGLLFYATEIERHEETYSGIHLNQYLGQILVFIEHARMVILELGYAGPLLLQMRMEAMCGVPWIYFEGRTPMTGPASELDDEVSFAIYTSSDELDQRPDNLAIDILRYVFFAMNWPDIGNDEQRIEGLIKSGYNYNMWPVTEELRK
jgi:hypothetical protein